MRKYEEQGGSGGVAAPPHLATPARQKLRSPRSEQAQSTVEFALVLPMIVFLLLGLLQAGLMLRDQLLVAGAAREAAREAAVSADGRRIEAAAHRAAPGLNLQLKVTRGRNRGDPARVEVSATPSRLPLVGAAVARHRLSATATMRVEREE